MPDRLDDDAERGQAAGGDQADPQRPVETRVAGQEVDRLSACRLQRSGRLTSCNRQGNLTSGIADVRFH